MSGNAHARNGQVYIVHWPSVGFTKVGFSLDSRRWRPYLRRGGQLLALIEPVDRHASVVEEDMHRTLCHLPRAFSSKADAAPYLGRNGVGWTECYQDHTGTSCTPPMEDPLTYPLKDQMSGSVQDVTTRGDDANLYARLVAFDELAARRAANQ